MGPSCEMAPQQCLANDVAQGGADVIAGPIMFILAAGKLTCIYASTTAPDNLAPLIRFQFEDLENCGNLPVELQSFEIDPVSD